MGIGVGVGRDRWRSPPHPKVWGSTLTPELWHSACSNKKRADRARAKAQGAESEPHTPSSRKLFFPPSLACAGAAS